MLHCSHDYVSAKKAKKDKKDKKEKRKAPEDDHDDSEEEEVKPSKKKARLPAGEVRNSKCPNAPASYRPLARPATAAPTA